MRRSSRGFTLVEVLVALAIAGLLMLAASGIYWQQRQVERRLAAQRAADRSLENFYELLRANPMLLVDGASPAPAPAGAMLILDVSPGDAPGLQRIDLAVQWKVAGQPFRRSLSALIFAP